MYSPGLGLSAGGLFGVQLSNVAGGGREGRVSFTDTLNCIDSIVFSVK